MKIRLLLLLAALCLPSLAHAQESVVAQAKQDLRNAGVQVEGKACTDFEIAKIVAGRLSAQGAGLLQKDCCDEGPNDPNRSHCSLNGVWYAHDIVAFSNGAVVDIAQDGGGANGPTWQVSDPDPGLVARYRSAVSLGLFGVVPGAPAPTPVPAPAPQPAPVPAPQVGTDYSDLLRQILDSQQRLLDSQTSLLAISKDTNEHVVNIDHTFAQTVGALSKFLGKYVAPAIGGFIAARKLN